MNVPVLLAGQQAAGRFRRQDHQFDLPPRRFLMHFRHHRHMAVHASADNQAPATPGQVFLERQGGVAIGLAVGLGRLFRPLANLATSDHHVVVISLAGDFDFTECCELGFHVRSSPWSQQVSLPRILLVAGWDRSETGAAPERNAGRLSRCQGYSRSRYGADHRHGSIAGPHGGQRLGSPGGHRVSEGLASRSRVGDEAPPPRS